MSFWNSAIERLETILADSGCEDGIVTLSVNHDADVCQYPKGVAMEGHFGGRSGQFITSEPVRANTRISFMFGAPLKNQKQRGAAGAIVNTVSAFLCLARRLQPCTPRLLRPLPCGTLPRGRGKTGLPRRPDAGARAGACITDR
ncbi:hypothetical protein [Methanoculleus chikugoensis]|uniref:hypothetical protein n=1 Tax=Methanoculleus chikugoensis TaxID=118126 RepID=UPI000B279693|nr:hypothetical protein [Methanoculleus chikugoensis]